MRHFLFARIFSLLGCFLSYYFGADFERARCDSGYLKVLSRVAFPSFTACSKFGGLPVFGLLVWLCCGGSCFSSLLRMFLRFVDSGEVSATWRDLEEIPSPLPLTLKLR